MENPRILKDADRTSIRFYTLDNRVEDSVRREIGNFFTLRNKGDWNDVIYSCVKELMVNASKSNIKKTFFIEAKISEQDKEIYEIAKTKVKKIMREEYFAYIRNKLIKHDHDVVVQFEDDGKGIVISVTNPNPLLADEEERIRKALRTAMSGDCSELALYYEDEDGAGEGASLGLIMIVQLLRQLEIDPSLFRIGVIEGNTVARIEIPLDGNYTDRRKNPSKRGKYAAA
ncbi:MAG: hypothetical protein A2Y33_02080 [Spirochaetes bacterium GWF1_51_8]|nr:MAG: hypothetical protein A2Y33_02080 [Spirochaetes bacterium GWF1_51_8]